MKYSSIDVDQYGRVIYCPFCGSLQLFNTNEYCTSCNIILINKCSDTRYEIKPGWPYIKPSCNTVLDGSSRYCINCGNESTFYQQELLESWIDEINSPDSFSEFAIKIKEEE